MRIIVVFNPNSGKQSSLDEIKQAFAAHGVEPLYIPINEIVFKLPVFLQEQGLTVAAAGGDGTINSVARHILGSPARLAIIPVGTLNHFARELGIPLEISAAVNVVLGAKTVQVDSGSVNDRVFINNSSIGWYPRSLRAREELSGHIGKWPAALIGSIKAIVRPRRYFVELTIDGKQITYRTPFVFVGNNEYTREPGALGQRTTLQGGQLVIYIVKAQNLWGILRIVVVGLFTKKQRDQDFAIYHARECIINTKHQHHLNVACDGEVLSLPTPLRYQSKPSSLTVLIP